MVNGIFTPGSLKEFDAARPANLCIGMEKKQQQTYICVYTTIQNTLR